MSQKKDFDANEQKIDGAQSSEKLGLINSRKFANYCSLRLTNV